MPASGLPPNCSENRLVFELLFVDIIYEQMERNKNIWERLLDYQQELSEVCDTISEEIDCNRKTREEWNERTASWKKIWLPDLRASEQINESTNAKSLL